MDRIACHDVQDGTVLVVEVLEGGTSSLHVVEEVLHLL
jgi:hypothetical protein